MSATTGKRLKRRFARLVARILGRPGISPERLTALRPRRVLIVRQHNQMGDMVCATPAFRAIAETWPDADIGLVCAPLNMDVVRHSPDLDEIFLFDKRRCRNPLVALGLLRRLRAFDADIAFVLSSVSFSVTSALLALASGAAVVVGSDTKPFGWDFAEDAFSLVMPASPAPEKHAVEHNLDPLRSIGIVTANLDTVVCSSEEEGAAAAEWLATLPASGAPLWIMHPGAGKVSNLWPADRFADIALRAARDGRTVVVLQGPADGETMARFSAAVAAAGGHDGIHLMPVQTVGVCVALLHLCDRFLCNDTGLLHVAGAVGVPTLTLFGPTDPAIWKPRSPVVTALRGESGELENLAVDEVWAALSALPGCEGGGR